MAILVVDDQLESRQLIERILQKEGHREFIMAESAPEALRHLGIEGAPPSAARIDLVVMDLRLPGMDGIQACRRIMAEERHRDLPVIVITASTEVGNLPAAFAAGAVDYLTKPLNPVELAARVRSALQLKREMDSRKEREQQLLEVTRRLEEANRELQRLSSLDGLTGLTNRRRLDEFIDNEWQRGARDGTSLSVILVDIDFFKAYNDRYGHLAGDECLKRVAGALRSAFRRPGDLVARYGGEEFAAILPGTDAAGAQVVAESMRKGVEDLKIPHEGSTASPRVTISLGFATMIPRPQKNSDELVAAADQALYRSKREGRNRVSSRG
jgi:diguanylate cyclase (GGDEF)-like protein